MRRTATPGRRAAAPAAAALLLTVLGCGSEPAGPVDPPARIFQVMEADGQVLPSHQPCPAPVEGMVTGAAFVAGELILYPERTFTWRYTIRQYATVEGVEEAWVEPVTIMGTYGLRGDSLALDTGAALSRRGRIVGETVELTETLPCHYAVAGAPAHQARLELRELRPAD